MEYKRFVLVEIVGVMSSAVEERPSSSAFSVGGDDGIGLVCQLLNCPARKYILLYEIMSIYLCQKMYKQSCLLHVLVTIANSVKFSREIFTE